MQRHPNLRTGFTLIELLVVIALMAVLAGLTITFFPNAANSAREARAAQLLQSWLNISKSRALRDQAPRGLRLNVNQTTIGITVITGVVTDCQFIEQPDDFGPDVTSSTGGKIQSATASPAMAAGYNQNNTIVFTGGPDIVNGYSYTPTDQEFWAIQPGDYLEILGTGLMYLITNVGVPDTSGGIIPDRIKIDPPLPYPITTPTTSYRILRAPRPLGNEALQLPTGTLIDINTNAPSPGYNNPLPMGPGYVDILFSPSGTVISRGAYGTNLNLWVRAPDEAAPMNVFAGSPTIVSIFTRTGFVGSFAVDKKSGNPYSNVK